MFSMYGFAIRGDFWEIIRSLRAYYLVDSQIWEPLSQWGRVMQKVEVKNVKSTTFSFACSSIPQLIISDLRIATKWREPNNFVMET